MLVCELAACAPSNKCPLPIAVCLKLPQHCQTSSQAVTCAQAKVVKVPATVPARHCEKHNCPSILACIMQAERRMPLVGEQGCSAMPSQPSSVQASLPQDWALSSFTAAAQSRIQSLCSLKNHSLMACRILIAELSVEPDHVTVNDPLAKATGSCRPSVSRDLGHCLGCDWFCRRQEARQEGG